MASSFLSVGFAVFSFSIATSAAEYNGGYKYEDYLDLSPGATVTCQEFYDLLGAQKKKPDTVIQALQILKSKKPAYFNRYTLFPKSESLHQSDWESPRAIVFGGNGHMVLTFNGNPEHKGYGALELMCFSPVEAKFRFQEITFPKEADAADLEVLSQAERKQPYVISPIGGYTSNAMKDCTTCHSNPARPIWDAYSRWPGAFGAVDDILFRDSVADDDPAAPYLRAEADLWKKFSTAMKGRYAILGKNTAERPNLAMGKLLAMMNMKRAIADLKRLGQKFDAKRFAKELYCPLDGIVYLEFSEPGGFMTSGFFPPSPIQPDMKRIMSSVADYLRNKDAKLNKNMGMDVFGKKSRYHVQAEEDYYLSLGFQPADVPYLGAANVVARMIRLEKFLQPLGIDLRDWSLIQDGGYNFTDGSAGPESGWAFDLAFDKPFLEAFFPNDDKLKALVAKRRDVSVGIKVPQDQNREDQEICDHLSR